MAAPNGLIVGYDGTNLGIPSGWSRVTALDSKFPKVAASAGSTGGSDNHTHTASSHSHPESGTHTHTGANTAGNTGPSITNGATQVAGAGHTHAATFAAGSGSTGTDAGGASSSASNLPPYYSVIFIKADGSSDIPSGAVAWWASASAPTNWSIQSATPDLRNVFLRGAATGADAGATGGAVAHTHTYAHSHTANSHTHTASFGSESGSTGILNAASAYSVDPTTHTHANVSSSSNGSATNSDSTASTSVAPGEPAWTKLYHVKATAQAAPPAGIIGLWDGSAGSIPTSWSAANGSNGTANLSTAFPYLKGAASSGELLTQQSDTSNHSHSTSHSHTTAAGHTHTAGAGVASGGGTTAVTNSTVVSPPSQLHTHGNATSGSGTPTFTSGSTTLSGAALEPAYYTVIPIQFTPPSAFTKPSYWRQFATILDDAAMETTEAINMAQRRARQQRMWASALLQRTVVWGVGGRTADARTIAWGVGGTARGSRTIQWGIAPTPNRIARALSASPVVIVPSYRRVNLDGTFRDDVTQYFLKGAIDANNDRDIFRQADFEIVKNSVINPLSDIIQPVITLHVDRATQAFPMGCFQLTQPEQTHYPGQGESWKLKANDISVRLQEDGPTAVYRVASGTNYGTAIAAILAAAGLRYTLPPTAKTLPTDKSYAPPLSWLKVINDLCEGVNWYHIWVDATGLFTTAERPTDLSTAAVAVSYLTNGQSIVIAPVTEKPDLTRLANKVIASSQNSGLAAPLVSVAVNSSPSSPVSTIVLGRTITKWLTNDAAADQATLDAYALSELSQSAALYNLITLLTSFDPRRDAHEIYQVSVTNPDGSTVILGNYYARNWRVALETGATMQHAISLIQDIT